MYEKVQILAMFFTFSIQQEPHCLINFTVMPPTLMKYIPSANPDTSICCVSAVILPERTVCPIRLVMQYVSDGRDVARNVCTNNTPSVGLG